MVAIFTIVDRIKIICGFWNQSFMFNYLIQDEKSGFAAAATACFFLEGFP